MSQISFEQRGIPISHASLTPVSLTQPTQLLALLGFDTLEGHVETPMGTEVRVRELQGMGQRWAQQVARYGGVQKGAEMTEMAPILPCWACSRLGML